MTSFREFVFLREFFTGDLAQDFHSRLRHSAGKIEGLLGLYAFCRLRWPDFYREHQAFLGCTGKQQMQRIWAQYLAWKEAL